jgi:hypothetical protein
MVMPRLNHINKHHPRKSCPTYTRNNPAEERRKKKKIPETVSRYDICHKPQISDVDASLFHAHPYKPSENNDAHNTDKKT